MTDVIENVRVVPGSGDIPYRSATVTLDDHGVVTGIEPVDSPADLLLVPSAVDLHLDNLRERRRPRATVELPHPVVIAALDAECAAAGIGVVCISARCEHAPGKGVELHHALEVSAAVEDLAPSLACDWRLHARVEVTDDRAVDTLGELLAMSSRIVLVSVMEHSAERTRFASVDENRRFYAEDWGVPLEQVDEILAAERHGSATNDDRRRAAAKLASGAGVALASHDDRSTDDVDAAHELGATVSEFPLTLDAARRAKQLGMTVVLGAPNVIRGRSTSPGNLLAADAIAAGAADALCSDYNPASVQDAAIALEAAGIAELNSAVDLIAGRPAATVGVPVPRLAVGWPLTASLRRRFASHSLGLALWRDGRRVFHRGDA